MTQPQAKKADLPRRVGLTHEAIFRLWKMAIKDLGPFAIVYVNPADDPSKQQAEAK